MKEDALVMSMVPPGEVALLLLLLLLPSSSSSSVKASVSICLNFAVNYTSCIKKKKKKNNPSPHNFLTFLCPS